MLLILITIIILSACSNTKEKNKEKYNESINNVISLEKDRVQELKLERKDIGIAVFSAGEYIELVYELKSKTISSIYQLDKTNNSYIYLDLNELDNEEEKRLDEILDKELEYIENLGLK